MAHQTYINDAGEEAEFTVLIIYGNSGESETIERFIREQLDFKTLLFHNDFSDKLISERFRNITSTKGDCAIILLSSEDKLGNSNQTSRQNIFYGMGYYQALFDSYYAGKNNFDPVLIIKEKTVGFRNLVNLPRTAIIKYNAEDIESLFLKLGKSLNEIYNELARSGDMEKEIKKEEEELEEEMESEEEINDEEDDE